MAEFQEVAEQKRRMCKMYNNNGCNGCPLSNGDCGVINVRYTDANDVQRVENVVMAWAAEHPEPVYPTWYEYLISESVLVPRSNYTTYDLNALLLAQLKNTSIPADIAQKLGLQPKEGI